MEYRYAVDNGKPVIAFLHQNPGSISAEKTEKSPEATEKLDAFRALCQTRVVKFWDSPQSLGSVVSRSIVRLIKDRPAVGWIRGSAVASDEANREILALRQKIDALQEQLRSQATTRPEGTDDLLQDGDELPTAATVGMENQQQSFRTDYYSFNFKLPFSQMFKKVGPVLLEEATESSLRNAVDDACWQTLVPLVLKQKDYADRKIETVRSHDDSFQAIKVQLIALGLIEKGEKKRPVSDRNVYWKLTPYGEVRTMAAIAMKKSPEPQA